MNIQKPKPAQFVNTACENTWSCPACYRAFSNISAGRAICQHCGQESELTKETQPVCVSTIVNDCEVGLA